MIKGIVVGHCDYGSSILNAVTSISGIKEALESVSNDCLSTNELTEIIRESALNSDGDGIIIFIDVFGGSCWRAAKMAKLDNAHIITGVNLPMVLSFVNKRLKITLDELVEVLKHDGKLGIQGE